jgi:hypothetical protein
VSRIDLLVEDTGDPEQLAHRLADVGGMPVDRDPAGEEMVFS